jgi:lipoprotein NlpI
MRRFLIAFLTLGAATRFLAAEADPLLRQVIAVSATNVAAALKLCDRAVAESPSKTEPLVIRAGLFDREGRYADALRDLSAALKLDAASPQLWHARGEVNFRAGHFQESVADFDHALQLVPENAPRHWQRGISLYYARRFEDGRKQFELHQTVNPNDVENAVWHFLCLARERGVTNARTAMLKVGPDARVPMREIDDLYRGSGSEEKVLSAAAGLENRGQQRQALFYAHLYLGLYFDVLGERGKAREHMAKAAGEFGAKHYMGDVARVHQALLQ